MARGQIYKYSDWELIGLNPFSGKSEGNNHVKENGTGAKFSKAAKGS